MSDFETIRKVNASINSVPYMKELSEDWRPAENTPMGKLNGADCDSYATGKMVELYKQLVPLNSMRLMECKDEKGGAHAVLLVDYGNETYVLDNRYKEPVLMEKVPYKWIRVQVPGTDKWEWA
jgi:predicted transglutaminase-like cysteine proteinase